MRRSEVTTVAESETARAAQAIGVLGPLAMAGWDDEAVLVIGNGQIAVHLFDLRDGQADLREYLAPITVPELALSVVDAHRKHPLQCRNHRGLCARRQQGAVFRMQRKGDPPINRHLIGRRPPRSLPPRIRAAVSVRLRYSLPVMR